MIDPFIVTTILAALAAPYPIYSHLHRRYSRQSAAPPAPDPQRPLRSWSGSTPEGYDTEFWADWQRRLDEGERERERKERERQEAESLRNTIFSDPVMAERYRVRDRFIAEHGD